jgi:uncharacterized protein (TIGR02597 family)
MKTLSFSILAAAAAIGFAQAQTAYTTPVGYVSQTCPANSDTRVGVPIRIASAFAGTLSANPDTTTTPGSAILSLSGTPNLTPAAFASTHYVNFGNGEWFEITANTATTITVNLNGDTIDALSAAPLQVQKFWTLGELFNPAVSTADPLTTGNAIVTSASTSITARRTSILVPDQISAGINLPSSATYYITGGVWRKAGDNVVLNYNNFQLFPDTSFIIRNPSTVTSATTYTATGEVSYQNFEVALVTRASQSQDNAIALPRPVNLTLNQLALKDSGAFLASASTSITARRDQILVFDNATAQQNKPSAATYYVTGGVWRKAGDNVILDYGNVPNIIQGGTGFIIRKFQTGTGATQIWNCPVPY